jgi:hypothetical protein
MMIRALFGAAFWIAFAALPTAVREDLEEMFTGSQ